MGTTVMNALPSGVCTIEHGTPCILYVGGSKVAEGSHKECISVYRQLLKESVSAGWRPYLGVLWQ